jgi:glycosyltransferase involved in cell wall biosynthesis
VKRDPSAGALRVLAICKRSPQQRDLLDRPYGRFHNLPVELAKLGHEVRVLLPSLRAGPAEHRWFDGVDWRSRRLSMNPLRTLNWIRFETSNFRPDWVLGFSDTWCGWLAMLAARHGQARLLVDAYDDYEAYMPYNLPLHRMWRKAVRHADVVTAAGPQLAARLDAIRPGRRPTAVLPMVADACFRSLARIDCRRQLSLPTEAPLLGYFGGWGEERGTHLLLQAFRHVLTARPDARLVLSGRPPAHVAMEPGVIALGYLADELLPVVLNAVDVACVISANTRFGRFSYPVKLCEAMACGVPVVATATDPIRWMLSGHPDCLVPVGEPGAFAARTLALLDSDRIDYGHAPRWTQVANSLGAVLAREGTV